MKKILVPIDFSANSKKTIRFAIQFASQTNSEIIFFHILSIMPSATDPMWDYPYYAQFQENEIPRTQNYLEKLIKKVYNKNLPSGVNYKCVCQLGVDIGIDIISYAEEQKASFICVGANGKGVLEKLFGTVATHLMVHSPIPVFIIPKNYRHKSLSPDSASKG
jgi:nucleotide-binding universal stress UspA family protein